MNMVIWEKIRKKGEKERRTMGKGEKDKEEIGRRKREKKIRTMGKGNKGYAGVYL